MNIRPTRPMRRAGIGVALVLALSSLVVWGQSADGSSTPPFHVSFVGRPPGKAVQALPGSSTAVHVITAPGLYYLNDEVVGEPGKNGIEIQSDFVTLDLTGFGVRGVPSALDGITTAGSSRKGTVIRNGNVVDWPGAGVSIDSLFVGARIERIYANGNGLEGIKGSWHNSIVECIATSNGNAGIIGGEGTRIERCVARGNAVGVSVGIDCVVADCVPTACGIGVDAFFGSATIEGNRVDRCNVGIQVGRVGDTADTVVRGNDITDSTTHGIQLDGPGALVIQNRVRESGTADYVIPPGNAFGPIVDVIGAGDLSAIPEGDHPWANFRF